MDSTHLELRLLAILYGLEWIRISDRYISYIWVKMIPSKQKGHSNPLRPRHADTIAGHIIFRSTVQCCGIAPS